jgi:hypothetical protein
MVDNERNPLVPGGQGPHPHDALVTVMLGGGLICDREPNVSRPPRPNMLGLPPPLLFLFRRIGIFRSRWSRDEFGAYHF